MRKQEYQKLSTEKRHYKTTHENILRQHQHQQQQQQQLQRMKLQKLQKQQKYKTNN